MMAAASGPSPLSAMTADGVEVFRPRLARMAGHVLGAVVLTAMTIVAIVIPGEFALSARATMVLLGVAIFVFCWREATVRVVASEDSLEVRNLFSSRTLEWPEVIAVSFPEGDAWAHLDLADGDTLATMALQRADGADGIASARRLSALVRERGEATGVTG